MVKVDGYEVIDLTGDGVIRLVEAMTLAAGHLPRLNPSDLVKEQTRLTHYLHDRIAHRWERILLDNASHLRQVVGEDVAFERTPYLRIARSGMPEDNIGIHRDTHYGASPAEWVLWIPLTEATDGAELRILPGSWTEPEEAYPWTQEPSEVAKGSEKHWLGFLYAPKRMNADTEARCIPIPCRVGQAILFNSASVHGQIVNTAPWTRVSMDIRLISESAMVKSAAGVRGKHYQPLSLKEAA